MYNITAFIDTPAVKNNAEPEYMNVSVILMMKTVKLSDIASVMN
jgi:hypothetical protein